VTLVCKGNKVVVMNTVRYALDALCEGMEGEFEKAGLYTDDDVVALVKDIRREMHNEKQCAAAAQATNAGQAAAPQADRVADSLLQV